MPDVITEAVRLAKLPGHRPDRKTTAFHIVAGRFTLCGRSVLRVPIELDGDEALALGAKPCKCCHDKRGDRQQPVVIPATQKAGSFQ